MTKEKGGRRFNFREYEAHFAPKAVLNRLERELTRILDLDRGWQSWVRKNKENPKTGTVEVQKEPWQPRTEEDVKEIVKSFYVEEGYTVNEDEKTKLIDLEKGDESYWAMVMEGDTSYLVIVMNNLAK